VDIFKPEQAHLKDKRVFILAALAEGTPINAVCRMFRVGKHASAYAQSWNRVTLGPQALHVIFSDRGGVLPGRETSGTRVDRVPSASGRGG